MTSGRVDHPEEYGEAWAAIYDEQFAGRDPTAAVDFLAELAGGGRAIELGIGTGRVALPLAARGVEVHGLDASEAMVARMRGKPGGESLPVTIGDFADVSAEGPFSLAYVVFNTLFVLLTQEAQVRCFASVARSLQPGGRFVVEVFVPDLGRFRGNQDLRTVALEADVVHLTASLHDPVAQRVDTRAIFIRGGQVEERPVSVRYAWPSELDLMARLAGLRLENRYGGWQREPFTSTSGLHVSVYQKPD